MTTVNDILELIETIAPMSLKMEWDNAGLLCGSRSRPVRRVLVALDPSEEACREAITRRADLLVTHHPLIFTPLRAITADYMSGFNILALCHNGISAINAHTNLDQAHGGVNDILAKILGLQNIKTIYANDQQLLRYGDVPEQDIDTFLATIKERLNCQGLRYNGLCKPVQKVAVGGGACGGEWRDALNVGCDTFVTADVKYHEFMEARENGLHLIDAGHFCTENPVCYYLADKICEAFPDVEVRISETHEDCVKYY